MLVTSGTVTSAELMARRLPHGVLHQYAPIDTPPAARRFVEHWRPDLAVFVESEIWPNLLFAAKGAGARLALMSARLSDKSTTGWGRLPGAARALFGLFDLVTVQDERTGGLDRGPRRQRARQARPQARRPSRCRWRPEALDALRAAAGRPACAGRGQHPRGRGRRWSPRPPRASTARPLLVVVPRHPERGEAVAEMLRGRGLTVARRGAGEPLTPEVEAYVADTLGELGLFYRLADAVVWAAASSTGSAGHNPLEPARLGKAVVSRAHTASFADTYAALLRARAVLIAHGPAELERAVSTLIGEPALARALGERAPAAAAAETEAFDAAWAALQPLLPPPPS